MTIPVKALSEIEVKSEVSENDKILILDSESEEARLASKEELKWDKWDTWPQWPQGLVWPKWEKWEKWDKWDTWAKWDKWDRWEQGIQWPQWLTGNTWPKWDTWEKWPKGDTWAEIDSAAFVLNDIKFHKDDWTYVTLADAKTILTWPKGDTWNTWPKWDTGEKGDTGDKWDKWDKGDTGASITSAVFDDDDIVFWKDDQTTVTLENAKVQLKWDKWDKGDKGDKGDAATITVWNVETTAAWTQAEITNSWTAWDAVFNFKIPKGDKWDTGAKWDTWAKWDTGNTWPQWVSVTNFQKISWTGAAGTSDTYEFTLSDGNTFQFSVYNWANGEWSWDMLAANNLADLTNFATSRNNLWVYSKSEVDTLISNFWWFEVVATLPSTNIKPNVIYMLWPIWTWPDKYEEWIYTNSTWTKIGETSVDLSNYFNTATQTSDAITEWSTNLFLTPQERTKLSNTSWTNTGDQSATDFDIKDLADSTSLRTTWNNKQNAIADLSDIRTGAGKWATAVQPWDLSAIATSGKLEDATWDADDISEGTDHKFLTSAERTKLGNTSWTNTGDETGTTIKTKLWVASSSADGYLKKEDFATFNWKQDAITDSDDITQWSINLFMTAGERTKLGNQSWTNTWDETQATIKTKLGTASASADWYLTKEDFSTFNGKQNAISDLAAIRSWAAAWATAVQSWDLKTVKWQSLVGSWDISINEPKISATAPSSPTEWMIWYDTTNNILKVYDWSNWSAVWSTTFDSTPYTQAEYTALETNTPSVLTDWIWRVVYE